MLINSLQGFLYKMDFKKFFEDSWNEEHYVLENHNGVLKLVKKRACDCITMHSKNLKELFLRYFSFFGDMDSEYFKKNIGVLKEHLNMSEHEIMKSVRKLYEEYYNKYPEKFI